MDRGCACIVTQMDSYQDTVVGSLKYLTSGKKEYGIFISTTKSGKNAAEYLSSKDVDTSKLLFFDISASSCSGPNAANCHKMPANASLAMLLAAILESAEATKSKFVFFDSVNTLISREEPKAAEKFFGLLFGKLREAGVCGVGVSLATLYPDDSLERVYQMFDYKIDVQ